LDWSYYIEACETKIANLRKLDSISRITDNDFPNSLLVLKMQAFQKRTKIS
jgi:hypothetical protein